MLILMIMFKGMVVVLGILIVVLLIILGVMGLLV